MHSHLERKEKNVGRAMVYQFLFPDERERGPN